MTPAKDPVPVVDVTPPPVDVTPPPVDVTPPPPPVEDRNAAILGGALVNNTQEYNGYQPLEGYMFFGDTVRDDNSNPLDDPVRDTMPSIINEPINEPTGWSRSKSGSQRRSRLYRGPKGRVCHSYRFAWRGGGPVAASRRGVPAAVRRRGDRNHARRPLPLGASRTERPAVGVGRGGLRSRNADADPPGRDAGDYHRHGPRHGGAGRLEGCSERRPKPAGSNWPPYRTY